MMTTFFIFGWILEALKNMKWTFSLFAVWPWGLEMFIFLRIVLWANVTPSALSYSGKMTNESPHNWFLFRGQCPWSHTQHALFGIFRFFTAQCFFFLFYGLSQHRDCIITAWSCKSVSSPRCHREQRGLLDVRSYCCFS